MTLTSFVNNTIKEVLDYLDPYLNFKNELTFYHSSLTIQGEIFSIEEKVHLFGVGKAASFEVDSFRQLLVDSGLESKIGSCVAYTKDGHTIKRDSIFQMEGSHPIVSPKNILNTKEFIKRLKTIPANENLIFLLSGGGSALLELPVEGLSFEELQKKHHDLLLSGANINEMNRQRKKLSQVKNGGLLNFIQTDHIIQFVTCDIPNERVEDVSSGPLMNMEDKEKNPPTFMIQSASKLLDRICKAQENRIRGKVYDCSLDEAIEDMLQNLPRHGQQHFSGGEIPVEVKSQTGKGGRNTHFVLAFACELYKEEKNRDLKILSLGTDGGDGPTDAAGAYIDFDFFKTLDPKKYLNEYNSYEYFQKLGCLIKTGPTKTNVMDVRCIWRE